MPKRTMTVRIEPEMRQALDKIAQTLERDRSHIVNEALEAYVETHRWQVEHIQKGLREAESRTFVSRSALKKTVRLTTS